MCKAPVVLFFVAFLGLLDISGKVFAGSSIPGDTAIVIPIGGNTWCSSGKEGSITKEGITGWSDPTNYYTIYFRVSKRGSYHMWLHLSVPGGRSVVSVLSGDGGWHGNTLVEPRILNLESGNDQRIDAGTWAVSDTGYQRISLNGVKKEGPYFANISSIEISGPALDGPVAYVPNDEGNFFYWGRRGPSVHLAYSVPKDLQAEYFYNEVTVPVGQDVQGSYFMADGFGQGYFGMQVNAPTERHILFSVWSPFQTNDPKSIPDSLRIVLVKKGEGVHAGAFGNEGSGGQSYLNYMWKAGNTYRFLVRARPVDNGYSEFTAWFYAPEEGKWRLIASFRRPKTQSWLTGLHSFLENFDPEQGDKTRYVLFNNQWVCNSQGTWIPVTKARFTGDNTARRGYRQDYAGGIRDNAFFLQNAGFFAGKVPLNTWFERPSAAASTPPDVDLSTLP